MASFGFEWTEFRGFGWDDPIFDLAYEEGVFLRKSLLNPPDLDGQLVLDAGCGNGRYSYWAARHGQWVFGVDLGDAVDAAARNTAEFQNIQIVQGDIFGLPFAPSTFDIVFSIGVLMHTGDARTAFESLVPLVALGGSLSIHVYGKGNPLYETVDRSLRARTTKLAIPTMERFTERAYRLRRLADRVGMARALNRFVRLDSHPVGIFDWYSAPVATHHTYDEVLGWFQRSDLDIVATNARSISRARAIARKLVGPADTVTVRGRAR